MYAVTVDLDSGAPVRSRVEPGSGGATSTCGRDADAGEDAMRSSGATLFFTREANRELAPRPGSMEIDAFNSIDKVGVVTSFCMAC